MGLRRTKITSQTIAGRTRKATLQWRQQTRRDYRQLGSWRAICRDRGLPDSLASLIRLAAHGERLRIESLRKLDALPVQRWPDLWSMPVAVLVWKIRHREVAVPFLAARDHE